MICFRFYYVDIPIITINLFLVAGLMILSSHLSVQYLIYLIFPYIMDG